MANSGMRGGWPVASAKLVRICLKGLDAGLAEPVVTQKSRSDVEAEVQVICSSVLAKLPKEALFQRKPSFLELR